MAVDLSKLDATGQVYGSPDADPVEVAKVWVRALGRKANDFDIQDEPAPFRNTLVRGATEWLKSYSGDFDYLLQLQGQARNVRRGQVFPSYRQAAGILNCLRAELNRQPKAPANGSVSAPQGPSRMAVEDAGVYVLPDGTVCKAQANKEKSKVYAKKWVDISGTRLVETGEHRHGEYQYVPGLIDQVIREGRKMTFEEAKAHSILYSRCVRCGRSLKDATSVEAAMGPICRAYFGG